MLRFKDTQIWQELRFHFVCRKALKNAQNAHKGALVEITNYKSECDALRSQVFEAKAIFDAMDAKHIEDKEAMALEIETMRADHLKLLGDFRLAEVEIKASNKYAYDANKATENLKAERQHLIGIVEGLKEDFEQYKLGAPAIMAQGEPLSTRIEMNEFKDKRIIVEAENVLQEASALSENAKQVIKDINELSSSPSPLTVAVAEAYIAEKSFDKDKVNFNDVQRIYGKEEVKRQLLNNVEPLNPEVQHSHKKKRKGNR